MRGLLLGVLLVVVLSCLVAPVARPGEAKELSGTAKIDSGHHIGWKLDIGMPSGISFVVKGESGDRFDLLLLDDTNYSLYTENKSFEFYTQSVLNTSSVSQNLSVLSGTVYVVIDNSNAPSISGAARSLGSVNVTYWVGSTFDFSALPTYSDSWLMYPLLVVVATALVAVVFSTRKAIRERRNLRE